MSEEEKMLAGKIYDANYDSNLFKDCINLIKSYAADSKAVFFHNC